MENGERNSRDTINEMSSSINLLLRYQSDKSQFRESVCVRKRERKESLDAVIKNGNFLFHHQHYIASVTMTTNAAAWKSTTQKKES